MKLSGVMCAHNEERFLPYSLYSIKDAPLTDLIVVLDRCQDRSLEIVRSFKPDYPVYIVKKRSQTWVNPISEVFNLGFSLAAFSTIQYIYALPSDVVYDSRIFNTERLKWDMVSFHTIQRDLTRPLENLRITYELVLRKLYEALGGSVWPGGIFAIKSEVWQKFKFRDTGSGYGENVQTLDLNSRLINAGFTYRHFEDTRNLHLRLPSDFKVGRSRKILNYPLWRVLFHSAIHLRPNVMKGYLEA